MKPVLGVHCLERPTVLTDHVFSAGPVFQYNWTSVTRDHLSWQTTFLWTMGWSFNTGSTVLPGTFSPEKYLNYAFNFAVFLVECTHPVQLFVHRAGNVLLYGKSVSKINFTSSLNYCFHNVCLLQTGNRCWLKKKKELRMCAFCSIKYAGNICKWQFVYVDHSFAI